MAPEVTVVLPTHNRWPLLARALASALAQEDVHHEVVVVDDGSADETPHRLEALAAGEDRLRVLRHDTGRGVARARNAAIDVARGDWIAFLDDDDVWAPRKLRAQLDAAAARAAGLAYGTHVEVDGALRPLRIPPAPAADGLRELLLRTNAIGSPSTFMAHAEHVRAVGGFDASLSALADWDLLIGVSQRTAAARCDDVVVAYVVHGDNMLLGDAARIRGEFDRLREKHGAAADTAGVEFGDLWLSSWSSATLRRSGRRLAAAAGYARRATRTRQLDDVGRAAAALFGERLHQSARRLLARGAETPPWLERYAADESAG